MQSKSANSILYLCYKTTFSLPLLVLVQSEHSYPSPLRNPCTLTHMCMLISLQMRTVEYFGGYEMNKEISTSVSYKWASSYSLQRQSVV